MSRYIFVCVDDYLYSVLQCVVHALAHAHAQYTVCVSCVADGCSCVHGCMYVSVYYNATVWTVPRPTHQVNNTPPLDLSRPDPFSKQ